MNDIIITTIITTIVYFILWKTGILQKIENYLCKLLNIE